MLITLMGTCYCSTDSDTSTIGLFYYMGLVNNNDITSVTNNSHNIELIMNLSTQLCENIHKMVKYRHIDITNNCIN